MRRHNSIVSNAERLLARAERVEESDEKIIQQIGNQPSMRINNSFSEDSYKDQINRMRRVLAKSQENARLKQAALEEEVEVLKRKLSRQGPNKRLNSYRAIVEDVVEVNTPHRFVRLLVLAWLVCNSVVFLWGGAALFACGGRRGIISTLCVRSGRVCVTEVPEKRGLWGCLVDAIHPPKEEMHIEDFPEPSPTCRYFANLIEMGS